MNLTERDDIRHAITQVMGFYGKEITDVQGKLWLRAIGHLPYDLLRQALADYPAIGKHAPKPVEIIGMVRDKQDELRRAEARNALPKPDDAPPCSAELSAAWKYTIYRWGIGLYASMADTPPELAKRYVEITNRQAAANNNPEAIPPEIWREDIWNAPASKYHGQRAGGAAA